MDEQQIPIVQLRQELTDQSQDRNTAEHIATRFDLLEERGVMMTAWMDTSRQRYLRGEIGGEVFETQRSESFTPEMIEELVRLVTPSINAQERRKRGETDLT